MIQLKKLFSPVASMEAEETRKFIQEHREGTYTLLDVRQPGEYEQGHIPGAKLIPLPNLPDAIPQLNPDQPIIPY